jgi:hypothetical protein
VEGALGSAESLVTSADRAPLQLPDLPAFRFLFLAAGSAAALPLPAPLPAPFSGVLQVVTAWPALLHLLHLCWYPLGQGLVHPPWLKSLQAPCF